MIEKKTFEKLKEIEMPEDIKKRIIKKCDMKMREKKMRKNNLYNFSKKPMVAVASLVVCLCLTSVTVLAATGKLQGFFKDVKRWDGAVIGTAYEQATDEITISIAEVSDELSIKVDMIASNAAPYDYFETFGIESYQIVDMNGNVIIDGNATDMAPVANRTATILVPLDDIAEGEYKLIISEMVGGSKADQPLVLSGTWEINFNK